MKKLSIMSMAMLCISSITFLWADPSIRRPNCSPQCALICFQVTDITDLGNNSYIFEFEVLNWTRYTSSTCNTGCLSPLGCRQSNGASVTGLNLVRISDLSNVSMQLDDIDPNGAPNTSSTDVVQATLVRQNGQLLADLGCDYRFIKSIDQVTNLTTPAFQGCADPQSCYSLGSDPDLPQLLFSENGACGQTTTDVNGNTYALYNEGDLVEISLTIYNTYGDVCATDGQGNYSLTRNDWQGTQSNNNHIFWNAGSNDSVIDPRQSNFETNCPQTCEQKDAGYNVRDGFTIRVDNFEPGERLVFNWYLSDDAGPIADGSAPTATNRGTLQPSPRDLLGFSYGSFQINREDCGANCDSIILGTPDVVGNDQTCLVDSQAPFGEFEFYVSMLSSGGSDSCTILPAIITDDRGIKRLHIRPGLGPEHDRMVLTFKDLEDSSEPEFSVEILASDIDPNTGLTLDPWDLTDIDGNDHQLLGLYEISGACHKGVAGFDSAQPLLFGVPQRADAATIPGGSTIVHEMDRSNNTFNTSGTLPNTATSDNIRITTITHLQDLDQEATHVIVTQQDNPLTANGNILHHGNLAAPSLSLLCDGQPCPQNQPYILETPTNNRDCTVRTHIEAIASNDFGSFDLSFNGQRTADYQTHHGPAQLSLDLDQSFSANDPNQTFTAVATDLAGNSVSATVEIQVIDKTPPVVTAQLQPQETPVGNNGGGGRGNSGNNGNNGNCSNRFRVLGSATDNCGAPPTLISVEIDGVDLLLQNQPGSFQFGDIITILNNNDTNDVIFSSGNANEFGRIHTGRGGILTVTYVDSSGNIGTATTGPSLPTVNQSNTSPVSNGELRHQ